MKTAGTNGRRLSESSTVRALFVLVPLGIAGNALFTILTTDRDAVASALSSIDPRYLVLALAAAVVPWFTHALRMYTWSRFLGNRTPLRDFFRIALGDELGSAVTPTSVGGNYFKLALLMGKGFSSGTAASLVALGTVENALFTFTAMPVIACVYAVPLVLACAVALLLRFTPLGSRAGGAVRGFVSDFASVYRRIIRRGKSRFLFTMALTFLQWTCRYSIVSFLLLAFHLPVRPLAFLFLQWLVFALTTVVPTPGGSAGAEMSFFLIFGAFVPASILGFVTSCWRFLTFYFQIVTAGLCFSAMSMRKEAAPPFRPPGTAPAGVRDRVRSNSISEN